MDSKCIHCNTSTTAEASHAEGHVVVCRCTATIHYRCIYPAKEISMQWGNKKSPSKLLIAFMQSIAIKYTCPTCRTTNNTPIPTTNTIPTLTINTTPIPTTNTTPITTNITTLIPTTNHNTTTTSTTSNNITIENKLNDIMQILDIHTTQINNIKKRNITTPTKLTNKTLTTSYAQAANTPTNYHTNTDIRLITDTDTNYTATTLTATTQTTVTNATYNTKFEDNINTILAILKSHTQQIQSLMTHNNNLTNKINNNISHHETHFTPTLLTSPPHTNYNTHFPHITNTLKHNTHTNYINIPKPTNHPQRLYTDNFTHNLIQPNINNLNTNLLKINRNKINRTEIPNRNVYNNHFSPINLNYNNRPQPITFLKPKLPNNTNLTVTIENIDKTNMNRTYINKLLTDLNINKNTVALVSFGNTSCFITFTTYTAKYYFTNLNFKLKNTPYNKLFIHNLLTPIQIRQKKCITMQLNLGNWMVTNAF